MKDMLFIITVCGIILIHSLSNEFAIVPCRLHTNHYRLNAVENKC